MKYTIFDALDLIDFECNNIDYDDLLKRNKKFHINRELRYEIFNDYWLLKLWWVLFKISPRMQNITNILIRFLGGHIVIGNFTFFGLNAMMFITTLRTSRGYWTFRPPCFNMFREHFTWGCFYFSPNATSVHPEAKVYYNDKY